ncbi:uncharacterized protein LOC101737689 [Bombyx mori]|uniref:HORMA domain-containing protein n=1 Tax=Bombyx mori TaxID=7091 RepID=A0A8R2DMP1_BOMMO|nr:uncharacterized protein LOC101737689 isoform X1 [Bombyx mori]
MSATATLQSQAVTEWVKLFPRTVTETYTSSVTFMKQLTVIAVSTVTYLKNVFPEDSYTQETFGGIKLRVLKNKCSDELAQFVSTALTQAFEAFDKKYLHQLALCFYEGECKVENLIEYHIFEYSYNPDGVTMDVHSTSRDSVRRSTRYSFDNVRERTIHLIRACVVIMQACQNELPSTYDVSLRLYYNDETPEGYQAPGFLSTLESEDHLAPSYGDAVKLGSVETPYHRLVARSYMKESMLSSREALPSQHAPVMTQNEEDDFGSEQHSTGTDAEAQVRCPCNKQDADDAALLTCGYCKKSQHAACFGVREEAAPRLPRHCCADCADRDAARSPTDAALADLTAKKRECLCIFRRALSWCGRASQLRAGELADRFQLSPLNALKLMKLLHSHGVIEDPGTDLATPRQIIKDELKNVMSKFFKTNESNIVERLLAETLSQGSQSDPVGDVLSPLEKINLQNTSTLGRVVQAEAPSTTEDSTLKQYRDAILFNDNMEELPLSGNHNPIQDMTNIGKRTTKRKSTDKAKRTGVKTKRARADKENN